MTTAPVKHPFHTRVLPPVVLLSQACLIHCVVFGNQYLTFGTRPFGLVFLSVNVAGLVLGCRGYRHARPHPFLSGVYQLFIGIAVILLALGAVAYVAFSGLSGLRVN
ncbi:hypothetical protein [Hymenobacter arizonensis]|uniref:Uncharacterized protein n=1 Tax=Hymenobacter arizonensis TaxID=1227077 RepID=A0A1I6BNK6_HYMAR|nr:hypothetical protein [Hymenobacter arizonensis]SFQ82528.1 hypothetical protein SAMN04515668_4831 [Hymenobacter arizonensis]